MECRDCKNKRDNGYISTVCLACKWQYIGQEAFDRKPDMFVPKSNDSQSQHEILGGVEDIIGIPWV